MRALGGPVRVVAGAGTGKTAFIADRFRRLVEAGVDPGRILVMTFTERASSEMRGRIEAALADAPGELAVGTFHSLAQRWLREDGWRLGIRPGFRILSGPERWIALRELMWDSGDETLLGEERPDELVGPLLKMLERLKQELVPIPRLRAWAAAAGEPEPLLLAAAHLFEAYARQCRDQGVLDFEDLIAGCVQLWESHPDLRRARAARFPYVLVDEYQDTNLAQERLVELVAEANRNVVVVGDDDQSIYRFRGASRASMERFAARFPDATTLTLGVNMRSSGHIVAAAAALIAHNPGRLEKDLRAAAAPGPPVRVRGYPDGAREAAGIAHDIAALLDHGIPAVRIAVLLRTNAMGRPITAALAARALPYRFWGASGLYQQPEVKDLVAALRLLHEPRDPVAAERITSRRPLTPSLEFLASLRPLAERLDVRDVFFELLARSRYLEGLPPADRAAASANVSAFAELMDEFCERVPNRSLGAFLAHLELLLLADVDQELPPSEAEDAIQVMSIHRAKGLEFDAVFVPSLVEGRLPQPRRGGRFELPPKLVEPAVRGREDQVAEERRLLYVAMTRARAHLFLSWARAYDGGRAWSPSRFLRELPTDLDVDVVVAPEPDRPPGEVRSGSARPRRVELSYTGIAAYRECPRQFAYRYVRRLPPAPSLEAEQGTYVHRVLMRLGQLRQDGIEVTVARLRDAEAECWSGVRIADPRRAAAVRRSATALLDRYVEAGGFSSAPLAVEAEFTVERDDWRLRGVIDRIDGGDPPQVIDYKTGSPLRPGQLRRDLQLALYALGAESALGIGRPDLELHYLKSGERVRVEATEELAAGAAAIVAEVADGVRREDFRPSPEKRRCRRCPYRLPCEAAL